MKSRLRFRLCVILRFLAANLSLAFEQFQDHFLLARLDVLMKEAARDRPHDRHGWPADDDVKEQVRADFVKNVCQNFTEDTLERTADYFIRSGLSGSAGDFMGDTQIAR